MHLYDRHGRSYVSTGYDELRNVPDEPSAIEQLPLTWWWVSILVAVMLLAMGGGG